MKYIFVTGGVMSGVGKGVAAASIAKILQSRGFGVTAIKIDPYVNVDAGTMNPTEVFGHQFVIGKLHDNRKRLFVCNQQGTGNGIWRKTGGSCSADTA